MVDRRQFLIGAGRVGAVLGAAGLLDACGTTQVVRPLRALRPSPTPTPSPSPATIVPVLVAPNPRTGTVAEENRRPGSRGWDLSGAPKPPAAQGFVTSASVAAGDPLDLHVSTPVPVRSRVVPARLVRRSRRPPVRVDPGIAAAPAAPTAIDPVTGRAESTGGRVVSVQTDASWPSGSYVAVFRPTDGRPPGATPFTIRPDPAAPPAPILFVSATATWQAYNLWGGADLYGASAADSPGEAGSRRAVQVSYDRPHLQHHGLGLSPSWELNFIRWQEREGRDVDYAADVDLELHPEVVRGRRLILFVGHHEYWSRPMRTTIETAIATGTNVAFLSANEMCWQVRLEASPLGPGRRMTCYKSARRDPLATTQPAVTTCRWREPPVNDPEAVVVGQMYGHIVARSADWVVAGSDHWLYTGTGLRDGDRIVNLVGQEYDTFFPSLAHPETTILARSPVVPVILGPRSGDPGLSGSPFQPLDPALHTATCYTAESGATVVAAGTFQWSWALDGFGPRSRRGVSTPLDPRVGRMTRNLLDRLG